MVDKQDLTPGYAGKWGKNSEYEAIYASERYAAWKNRKVGLLPVNLNRSSLAQIKQAYGEPPWEHPIVRTDFIWVTVLCMPRGMQNPAMYHDNTDEFWMVLEGEIEWTIEGVGTIRAKPGDFVFCEHGRAHSLRTVSEEPSIRLAFLLPWPDQYKADSDRRPGTEQTRPKA